MNQTAYEKYLPLFEDYTDQHLLRMARTQSLNVNESMTREQIIRLIIGSEPYISANFLDNLFWGITFIK